MGKRTSTEHDLTYQEERRRFCRRFQQILENPDFLKEWERLKLLGQEVERARRQRDEIDGKIVSNPESVEQCSDDLVWEDRTGRWEKAHASYAETLEEYKQARRTLCERFGLVWLPDPREVKSIDALKEWVGRAFLEIPPSVVDEQPVEPVVCPPSMRDPSVPLASPFVFFGNRLILVVNLDRSNRSILAAVDGLLHVQRSLLPQRKRSQADPAILARRAEVFKLADAGKKPIEIAQVIFSEEMKSPDRSIRKRARQRVIDDLRSRKK